jgi:hypothetical protein
MCSSRSNPSGSPGKRPPALLRLLAVARYDASPRLAFNRFPGLRVCQKDTNQVLMQRLLAAKSLQRNVIQQQNIPVIDAPAS